MPVISFSSPKGGAGKSTSAILLATQLALHGASVCIIDADPEEWIASRWKPATRDTRNIHVVGGLTDDAILDAIEKVENEYQFVIVDLEGTANALVSIAVAKSDFVIIPCRGSGLDATAATKAIKLVLTQGRLQNRKIPYSILMTCVSAAFRSRALKHVVNEFKESGIPVFETHLVERAAFRDIMDYGGFLKDLDSKNVSNIQNAISNAEAFTSEVIAKLRETDV